MEQLEETLKKTSIEKTEEKEKVSYEGLKLIEEKAYNSGTSIKYWM